MLKTKKKFFFFYLKTRYRKDGVDHIKCFNKHPKSFTELCAKKNRLLILHAPNKSSILEINHILLVYKCIFTNHPKRLCKLKLKWFFKNNPLPSPKVNLMMLMLLMMMMMTTMMIINCLFVYFADWHHAVFVFPSFPVGISRDWLCLREDSTNLRNFSRHRALPYNVKP